MTEIHEAIGELKVSTKFAHEKLHKLDTELRTELKEINDRLKHIDDALNKGKGWASAALLIAGAFGSIVSAFITYFISSKP